MYLPWLNKYNLLIFDEIDSTNSEAIRLAKASIEGDFIIWAKKQTAGRGRYSKIWHSDSDNFYISLLLDRNIAISIQPQLSFVTSLTVYDTILSLARKAKVILKPKLKWPNDILIAGKKVSGILLESIEAVGTNYLIIGVGINLLSSPANLERPVTNLYECGIQNIDADQVLDIFISAFDKYFAIWQSSGFLLIREYWLKNAAKLNEPIVFDNGLQKISGIFQDIDSNGNIHIKSDCGRVARFSAGEVFFS